MRTQVRSPGLAQWDKDLAIAMSCGVGRRRGWDPALLWLRLWLADVGFDPSLGTFICHWCGPKKKKKLSKGFSNIHPLSYNATLSIIEISVSKMY